MPPVLHTTLPALIGLVLAAAAWVAFLRFGVDINLGVLVPLSFASALGGAVMSTVRGVRALRGARRENATRVPGVAGVVIGVIAFALFALALYAVVFFVQHMHL